MSTMYFKNMFTVMCLHKIAFHIFNINSIMFCYDRVWTQILNVGASGGMRTDMCSRPCLLFEVAAALFGAGVFTIMDARFLAGIY